MSRLLSLFSASVLSLSIASMASAQTTLFFEDFEQGLVGWTTTGLWRDQPASQPCSMGSLPFPSGSRVAWYGNPSNCQFANGWGDFDYLTSTTDIIVPSNAPSVSLSFSTRSLAEDATIYDLRIPEVSVDGGPFQSLGLVFNSPWQRERFDLSFAIGRTIRLRFHFDPVDSLGNDSLGWMLDDIRVETGIQPGTPFCFGDGSVVHATCPCMNLGAAGRGCASSFNPAGALLECAGVPSVSADTLSIVASGVSNAAAILAQSQSVHIPHGFYNGDGLLCLSGSLMRIQNVDAIGGVSTFPSGGVGIAVRGGLPPAGGRRYYQVRYRNAVSFCTPATYNFTNALVVTWTP